MSGLLKKAAVRRPRSPSKQWRYRYIEGIGNDVNIEFVDTTMSGEYHMTMDPSEKDALLYVPGAGLTMMEQMGFATRPQRFNATDGTHLGTGSMPLPESMNEFTRLDSSPNLQKPPAIKFNDLEVGSQFEHQVQLLPMKVRAGLTSRLPDLRVLDHDHRSVRQQGSAIQG